MYGCFRFFSRLLGLVWITTLSLDEEKFERKREKNSRKLIAMLMSEKSFAIAQLSDDSDDYSINKYTTKQYNANCLCEKAALAVGYSLNIIHISISILSCYFYFRMQEKTLVYLQEMKWANFIIYWLNKREKLIETDKMQRWLPMNAGRCREVKNVH